MQEESISMNPMEEEDLEVEPTKVDSLAPEQAEKGGAMDHEAGVRFEGVTETGSRAKKFGRASSVPDAKVGRSALFTFMIHRPVVFMAVLPILWVVFISLGWSQDDKVEDQVSEIWTQQRSEYKLDKEYADNLGVNDLGSTTFAALATSRDGSNIITTSRLEEIRARMETTEATTIEFNGHTIAWSDICARNNVGPGTTYQFPCTRITPMDFFQESRWFFDEVGRVTWYNEVVRKLIIRPRLERFGILQGVCSDLSDPTTGRKECNHQIMLRNSEAYAVSQGYPKEYATPLGLFADIGSLEYSDDCKDCIETEFESTIDRLEGIVTPMFSVLGLELQRSIENGNNDATTIELAQKVGALLQRGVSRQDIIDYFKYTVTRQLYASFGAESYVTNYEQLLAQTGALCSALLGQENCPSSVSIETAQDRLKEHADHAFSSDNTAGIPFPFWSDSSPAVMFAGMSPVGGSGVDLSGTAFSTTAYLDMANYNPAAINDTWNPKYVNGQTATPGSPSWNGYVASDPVFKWFIAAVTPMTANCGNELLMGTQLPQGFPNADQTNQATQAFATAASMSWCTQYDEPLAGSENKERTVQFFARKWYDLLIDSESFLGLRQGESDPYVWTTGEGCGYRLGGERAHYTGVSDDSVLLHNASGQLYYIDEGSSIGPVDRNILMGGTVPAIAEYSQGNPLEKAVVLQTLYPALLPRDIVNRLKNCNRPGGAIDITESDAEEILLRYKEAFEDAWSKDWNKEDSGEVQFVGFFDDSGVVGTTGRLLEEITLDNGTLMAVSIIIIAVFSAAFLFDCDLVESRVLVTVVGVALVLLSFFAAVGFALMIGIKINITIAWTLPFIMLGLGVDDMYIVLLALKKQRGYSEKHFFTAMKEVLVPVSMTSMVNASMFAIMNISDVPAVYLTAQVALISVIFLYLTVVFCFPIYCWFDMRRQAAGRYDVLVCKKRGESDSSQSGEDNKEPSEHWSTWIYDGFYRPLLLNDSRRVRFASHSVVWLATMALFGLGIWGLTEREIGLGLEDFFPEGHQAHRWATIRTEELASWSVAVNWGALDYGDPDTQLKMIKQYEDVIATPHIAEAETRFLWLADLQIWASRHCGDNFDREDPVQKECGRDQVYPGDNSTCSATWVLNTIGLRNRLFSEEGQCVAQRSGLCRPSKWMHPLDLHDVGDEYMGEMDDRSWCPVLDGWDNGKMQFCVGRWRQVTGGGGKLLLLNETGTPREDCEGEHEDDEIVQVPILFSQSPTLFAYDLTSHSETLKLIEETRGVCDNNEELHCWMLGIPYDYWSQYVGIFSMFWEIGGASVGVGFVVSFLFLYCKLTYEGIHSQGQVIAGSVLTALLIALTTFISLITVAGISVVAGVSLTGFSNMSFVLSVGFAVEYAVHVIARWLRADPAIIDSVERVEYTMSFLTLPTFMSFASSTIGVACLAFTDFNFNEVYFFRPLIIVMFVTYFYGCWWLPCLLVQFRSDLFRLGKPRPNSPYAKNDVYQPSFSPPVEHAERTNSQGDAEAGGDNESADA